MSASTSSAVESEPKEERPAHPVSSPMGHTEARRHLSPIAAAQRRAMAEGDGMASTSRQVASLRCHQSPSLSHSSLHNIAVRGARARQHVSRHTRVQADRGQIKRRLSYRRACVHSRIAAFTPARCIP